MQHAISLAGAFELLDAGQAFPNGCSGDGGPNSQTYSAAVVEAAVVAAAVAVADVLITDAITSEDTGADDEGKDKTGDRQAAV